MKNIEFPLSEDIWKILIQNYKDVSIFASVDDGEYYDLSVWDKEHETFIRAIKSYVSLHGEEKDLYSWEVKDDEHRIKYIGVTDKRLPEAFKRISRYIN